MTPKIKKLLETTKLTADTITALIPIIKMLLVAAASFTIAMLINTKYFDKKEQEYLAQMREFKEQSTRTSQYVDSLKIQIAAQENDAQSALLRAKIAQRDASKSRAKITLLRDELDSLKETITDSVEMARLIIPKQDSVIYEQSITITKQVNAIENLNTAIFHKDSTITLLTISRDSLQQIVNNTPVPPKPQMFPKITRNQAFVSGIVSGILLTVLVF
jgi:hypothetical protein